MKIIVTGASGYVGQSIVPILSERAEAILLVGRDPAKLERAFPGLSACVTSDIATKGQGFDILVHLAVLNNSSDADDAAFHAVNVDLTLQTAELAKLAGVQRFYNISSVHVLDDRLQTAYARSKRAAVEFLANVKGLEIANVYLPYVRGLGGWNGKLQFLNRLPTFLRRPLSSLLTALKPTVAAERLGSYVLDEGVFRDETILSDGQSNNRVFHALKRTMDLLFAVVIVGLLWWALFIVWVLVRLSSPGPGIFAQERVGMHGTTFTCYKFRTMKQNTTQAGTHEVSEASVTGIGRFLRRTKIDELPQVWNIFRNEISLIGPRPSLPIQTTLFQERNARGVFDVKPGISGLAQINGIDMSNPENLAQWDARYIALQSFLLDIKITLATVTGRGQGDRTAK